MTFLLWPEAPGEYTEATRPGCCFVPLMLFSACISTWWASADLTRGPPLLVAFSFLFVLLWSYPSLGCGSRNEPRRTFAVNISGFFWEYRSDCVIEAVTILQVTSGTTIMDKAIPWSLTESAWLTICYSTMVSTGKWKSTWVAARVPTLWPRQLCFPIYHLLSHVLSHAFLLPLCCGGHLTCQLRSLCSTLRHLCSCLRYSSWFLLPGYQQPGKQYWWLQ